MAHLNEKKSISQFTVDVSSEIVKKILDNSSSKNVEQFIGNYSTVPFKKGSFLYHPGRIIDAINVQYEIYYCENDFIYNFLMKSHILDCMANKSDMSIKISIAYVNGKLQEDFWDLVHHEIHHLFQGAMGSSKNDVLYALCAWIINNESKNNIAKAPAFALYLTFKHEQDSFTHQLYSQLKRIGDDGTTFNDALNAFPIYSSIVNTYNVVRKNINTPEVIETFSLLGMTPTKWKRIVRSGIKRLKRKLLHAYDKFKLDQSRKIRMESVIMEQLSSEHKIKTEQFLNIN